MAAGCGCVREESVCSDYRNELQKRSETVDNGYVTFDLPREFDIQKIWGKNRLASILDLRLRLTPSHAGLDLHTRRRGDLMTDRLRILTFSENRVELRRLTRFLQVVGYPVTACADLAAATKLVECEHFDALIADGVESEHLLTPLLRAVRAQEGFTYCLMQCSPPSPLEVVDLFQAGWDDLLATPLVHGELLARLRAAARVVEYERRRLQQQKLDPRNLLPERLAWLQQLRTRFASPNANGELGTIVLVEMDQLTNAPAAIEIARKLATAPGCEGPACWNPTTFALFFPSMTEVETQAWGTEFLAGGFRGADDETSTYQLPQRGNMGVAGVSQERGWDDAGRKAESALQMARDSGGGLAVTASQAESEQAVWSELAGDGRLFETTTAADVMTPCPLVLSADDTPQKALSLLRQTEMAAIPVVDRQGMYLGSVSFDQLSAAVTPTSRPQQSGSLRLLRHLCYQPPRFDAQTSLSKLVEFFAGDPSPFAIVLRQRRPIGMVDCQSLATLNSPPTWDELAPASAPHPGSRYLLLAESG
jgi:CheY-like chemotaxis protein/predicted transcriptional regulator